MQGYALRQGLRWKKPSAPAAPFVGVFELGGASAQVRQPVLSFASSGKAVQSLQSMSLQLVLARIRDQLPVVCFSLECTGRCG